MEINLSNISDHISLDEELLRPAFMGNTTTSHVSVLVFPVCH